MPNFIKLFLLEHNNALVYACMYVMRAKAVPNLLLSQI